MRQARAKNLRREVIAASESRKIIFHKIFYRRMKKIYNRVPRTKRSDFTIFDNSRT